MRNTIAKFPKLLKEWTAEIVRSTVVHRIPAIPPPLFILYDRKRHIRRPHREDTLPHRRGRSLIDKVVIAKHQSPLQSTHRTERRRRNGVFLARKNWGNFLQEDKIVGGHLKRGATVLTRTLHGAYHTLTPLPEQDSMFPSPNSSVN